MPKRREINFRIWPKMVPRWCQGGPWTVVLCFPALSSCSSRVMLFCQDHDPLPGYHLLPGSSSPARTIILYQHHLLPGSSSSARIIIFCKDHHPLSGPSCSSNKVIGGSFSACNQNARCHDMDFSVFVVTFLQFFSAV